MSGLYGACDVQGVISGAVVPAKPVPGGCIENLPRCYWQQLKSLVTSSIIKSDVVPALRAGAASLFSGGMGSVVSDLHGPGFEAEYF